MINVGIVGSTGYGGCELVRFLLTHPNVNIEWVSSRTYSDQEYSDVYKIKRNGELTKNRVRKENNGSMECGFISCINCNFVTDCDLRCDDYPHIKIHQKGSQLFFDTQM